jgi:hypothetical protein
LSGNGRALRFAPSRPVCDDRTGRNEGPLTVAVITCFRAGSDRGPMRRAGYLPKRVRMGDDRLIRAVC